MAASSLSVSSAERSYEDCAGHGERRGGAGSWRPPRRRLTARARTPLNESAPTVLAQLIEAFDHTREERGAWPGRARITHAPSHVLGLLTRSRGAYADKPGFVPTLTEREASSVRELRPHLSSRAPPPPVRAPFA